MNCRPRIAVAEISKIRVARIPTVTAFGRVRKKSLETPCFSLGELRCPKNITRKGRETHENFFLFVQDQISSEKDEERQIYDGNLLDVNSNANGVYVSQNWNFENANPDIALSVQGISKLNKSTTKGAFIKCNNLKDVANPPDGGRKSHTGQFLKDVLNKKIK